MKQALSRTRFLALISIVCIFILATVLMIYGAYDTILVIAKVFGNSSSDKIAKTLILDSIELVDLFLLATVFYVTAVGLYDLFIDDNLPLPEWMSIHNLDDLKNKLISVIIVVLGVTFLGQVISGVGAQDLFWSGAGLAVVIGSLTFFLRHKTAKKDDSVVDPRE